MSTEISPQDDALLKVRDLSVRFPSGGSNVTVVEGVSFEVARHEILGIVGESGSGKSVTMSAVAGLLRRSGGEINAAQLEFDGIDLRTLSGSRFRRLQGKRIGVVFQDPMTALNPVYSIGDQIGEAVRTHHRRMTRRQVRERVIELLKLVGIREPERRIDQYPHEFSGGMRQRVVIAMAMANDPDLLIADEPTTALDVTIQAEILGVIKDIQARTGMAVVLITHDLGVVAEIADRVLVMYAGRVVETCDVDSLFHDTRHPYTASLLRSRPTIEGGARRLLPIPGAPPSADQFPPGCRFHPRCPIGRDIERCATEEPALRPFGAHATRCHFPERVPEIFAADRAEEVLR